MRNHFSRLFFLMNIVHSRVSGWKNPSVDVYARSLFWTLGLIILLQCPIIWNLWTFVNSKILKCPFFWSFGHWQVEKMLWRPIILRKTLKTCFFLDIIMVLKHVMSKRGMILDVGEVEHTLMSNRFYFLDIDKWKNVLMSCDYSPFSFFSWKEIEIK